MTEVERLESLRDEQREKLLVAIKDAEAAKREVRDARLRISTTEAALSNARRMEAA